MHNGITWYEIRYDCEGKVISIEIGCDYNHIDDYPRVLEEIIDDCVKSIDDMLERFPKMLN